MPEHEEYMRMAIEQALKGEGQVEPNPMVGAVIVEGDRVVAKGYHQYFGGPHAECNVLDELGRQPAENAVLYVTLEPCCTQGKTGPCTDVIINAGIKHVVLGAVDPNPVHDGKGIRVLEQAGVKVTKGVLAAECAAINKSFNQKMERF